MIRSVFGLVAMLVLVTGAGAQDTASMQRAIGALSSPPEAEEIEQLGANNPNAYVYFLQDYLSGTGGYDGPVSGQLTTPTIRAIVGFCREAGFVETCIRGPLLPESIAAVSRALSIALTPAPPPVAELSAEEEAAPAMEEPVAEAEAAEATPAVAAVEPPVLPEGWRLNDNGGRGPLGIEVTLVSSGPAEAVFRIVGTATRQGYFNIEVGPSVGAEAGTWATTVTVERESAEGSGGAVFLRTARFAEKSYLGELFGGIPIEANAAEATLEGMGEPSEDTVRLLPYVQVAVQEGDQVDTTISLSDPSFARSN